VEIEMRNYILILLVVSACAVAGFRLDFYNTAVASDYTDAQIQNATLPQIINQVYPEMSTADKTAVYHANKRGIGKVKSAVVAKRREDVLQAKLIQARDAIRAVFPECTFERLGDDQWTIDLDGQE